MVGVAKRAELLGGTQRFEAMADRKNVLRRRELGLKCVAPGIRCWGCFCEMAALSKLEELFRKAYRAWEKRAVCRDAVLARGR